MRSIVLALCLLCCLSVLPTLIANESLGVATYPLYPRLYPGDRVQVINPANVYYGQFGMVIATNLGGGPAARNELISVRLDSGLRIYITRWQVSDKL